MSSREPFIDLDTPAQLERALELGFRVTRKALFHQLGFIVVLSRECHFNK